MRRVKTWMRRFDFSSRWSWRRWKLNVRNVKKPPGIFWNVEIGNARVVFFVLGTLGERVGWCGGWFSEGFCWGIVGMDLQLTNLVKPDKTILVVLPTPSCARAKFCCWVLRKWMPWAKELWNSWRKSSSCKRCVLFLLVFKLILKKDRSSCLIASRMLNKRCCRTSGCPSNRQLIRLWMGLNHKFVDLSNFWNRRFGVNHFPKNPNKLYGVWRKKVDWLLVDSSSSCKSLPATDTEVCRWANWRAIHRQVDFEI